MTQTNAANRKEIARAEKAARASAVARGDVLRSMMSTAPGREWMWDRLSAANVFSTVFNDSPTRMAFLEGQRCAGLELLNDVMEFCPEQFIQAMREANGRRTADRIDTAKSASTGLDGDAGRPEPTDDEIRRFYEERVVFDPDAPGGYRLFEEGRDEPRQ